MKPHIAQNLPLYDAAFRGERCPMKEITEEKLEIIAGIIGQHSAAGAALNEFRARREAGQDVRVYVEYGRYLVGPARTVGHSA